MKKNIYTSLLLLISVFISPLSSFSQSSGGTIEGYISYWDIYPDDNIEESLVELFKDDSIKIADTTTSDYFSFSNLEAGKYNVRFKSSTEEKVIVNIELDQGETKLANISLRHPQTDTIYYSNNAPYTPNFVINWYMGQKDYIGDEMRLNNANFWGFDYSYLLTIPVSDIYQPAFEFAPLHFNMYTNKDSSNYIQKERISIMSADIGFVNRFVDKENLFYFEIGAGISIQYLARHTKIIDTDDVRIKISNKLNKQQLPTIYARFGILAFHGVIRWTGSFSDHNSYPRKNSLMFGIGINLGLEPEY